MARRPLITTVGQIREAIADLPDKTIFLAAVGPARGPHFRWSDVRLEDKQGGLAIILRVTPFIPAPRRKKTRA